MKIERLSDEILHWIIEFGVAFAFALIAGVIIAVYFDVAIRRFIQSRERSKKQQLEHDLARKRLANDPANPQDRVPHLVTRITHLLEYIVEAIFYFTAASAMGVLAYFLRLSMSIATNGPLTSVVEIFSYAYGAFSLYFFLYSFRQMWKANAYLGDIRNFKKFEERRLLEIKQFDR